MERETCSLTKFSSSGLPFLEPIFFLSLVFGSYWLIVTWCIVLLLQHLPSVLLGLFVHLPFSFSASWLRHESWGGVDRYPKYFRLTLPWILVKYSQAKGVLSVDVNLEEL